MEFIFYLWNFILLIILSTALLIAIFLYKIGYFFVKSNKVDRESSLHGGELVADVLQAHKVKFIFTLTGGHISPILVASENRGIRVVDTRHEATAVFAADAVARLSGTVGVVAVTAGPGLTNTVTAVKNAQMAESPILLIGGAAATLLKGRGALQDIDQLSLFKPLCKYCVTISTLRDIKPALCKALKIAQSDTPGPVFVEFPIDTLYPYKIVKQELGMSEGSKGPFQRFINFYLSTHVDNLFAGAFDSAYPVKPLSINIMEASENQIQKTIELISQAKRPVVLLGSQSTLPPISVDVLSKSIEKLGIPCFLGGMARGLLGKDSSLQMRHCRKQALKEADLVILGGLVCDFRMSYGRVLSHKSKIVSINRNKTQLYKNSDMFWKPTVAIQGDVASTLLRCVQKVDGYKCPQDWIEKLRSMDNEKEKSICEMSNLVTDVHLNPVKVLMQFEKMLPDKSILIADGGDFVGTAAYILKPRGALTWLDPGAFGTLGCGGGFALGAKLCRPDHDVFIVYGDGSFGYSMAEYDTFTRHKTPIVSIIGNDACWSQIARDQIRLFNTPVASLLAFCDYGKVAEGLGGIGLELNRSNEAEMNKVFIEAVQLSRGKTIDDAKSVLINCLIGKTSFRDGSISV